MSGPVMGEANPAISGYRMHTRSKDFLAVPGSSTLGQLAHSDAGKSATSPMAGNLLW